MRKLLLALSLSLVAGAVVAQNAAPPKQLTEEERAKIDAQRRAGCKAHEENLKMLKGSGPLAIEEDGKQREMTPAERQAQIDQTEQILAQYCGIKKKEG